MKYLLQIVLLTFFLSTVSAQEKHFVFIQSDNKQPFYVSINGKIFSSTASGYVIIPKQTEGEYNAVIGFAGNSFPEQSFKYVIDKKDLGFNLKNFGEKGWGLFNLQTLAVTMAGEVGTNVARAVVEKPKEEYTPEITFEKKKEKPVAKAEPAPELKPVVTDTAINKEAVTLTQTSVTKNDDAPKSETTTQIQKTGDEPAKTTEALTSTSKPLADEVKKVSEVKGSMGTYITYVDGSDKSKDTIEVIIPKDNKRNSSNSSGHQDVVKASDASNNAATTPAGAAATNDGLNNNSSDLKFLNMNMKSSKTEASATPSDAPVSVSQPVNGNSCKNVASDDDVVRLRRKMALQGNDEKMINEAKKLFRNNCLTTSQVKALSTLFMSDEGRYKFFDASYEHIADAEAYYSLQGEFIDPYFINRFKAMLRK
jgi:hypothetical protein